jgi:hypothetical protein
MLSNVNSFQAFRNCRVSVGGRSAGQHFLDNAALQDMIIQDGHTTPLVVYNQRNGVRSQAYR